MNQHIMHGCTSIILSDYLKSLGMFRIIAEQADSEITAYWKNEEFVIETKMDEKDIIEFILTEYKPTPIVAPWSFSKYEKTINIIHKLVKNKRFSSYKGVLEDVDKVIRQYCTICDVDIKKFNKNSINKKTKHIFLRLCRNNFPDELIPWLDAVFVLENNSMTFAPILGSGGNDGNFDMAQNFAKYLNDVFNSMPDKSKRWLEASLFNKSSLELYETTMVGHNPDGNGSPTSGQGYDGKSLSNPWDYILMLEGIMLFAGNVARRQSQDTHKAVFPFTTNASPIGYATASNNEKDSRGEIWLPTWDNPATYKEISYVFNEGRIQLNGKQGKTGTDFARAVINMGAERGISGFQRFNVVQRKGDAYLYINSGKISSAEEKYANLLNELDEWYGPISNKSSKKEATASIIRLVRNFDTAILEFCKYRKREQLLNILILVGKIERYISGQEDLKPLQKISHGWLDGCYDNSSEFRLASSIASIIQENNVGSIRENLQSIEMGKYGWEHKKDSVSFVWKEDDHIKRNMSRVLMRRGLDGKIKSLEHIPINGNIPVIISDLIEFLNGRLDMKKINDLVLPLSMIDRNSKLEYPWEDKIHEDIYDMAIPEAYMIMKLIYPPDSEEKIPYDLSVLTMLYAKRIDDGYAKASRILYSHGLPPKKYLKKGTSSNTSISNVVSDHIMAALLFPISVHTRKNMLKLAVIKNQSFDDL